MKKLAGIALVLCVVFAVTGCNQNKVVVGKFGCTGTAAQVVECEDRSAKRRELAVNTASEGF